MKVILILNFRLKIESQFCWTPALGLGLGVDFTFTWDNKNKNNKNNKKDKNKNNPHLNFSKGTVLVDKEQGVGMEGLKFLQIE